MHVAREVEPPSWAGPPGVSFLAELVAALLDEFTRPGDVVLDPFVGYGTTLVVAQRMGREGIGVELLPERVAHVRDLLEDPAAVFEHDARNLAELGLPLVDASVSSPPYMTRTRHPENPLTGYGTFDGDYDRYIGELVGVYRAVARGVRRGGPILINVATLEVEGEVTELAADLAGGLVPYLDLVEVIRITGPTPASWMVDDLVLVLRSA